MSSIDDTTFSPERDRSERLRMAITYVSLQPCHLKQVHDLLTRVFWDGIDGSCFLWCYDQHGHSLICIFGSKRFIAILPRALYCRSHVWAFGGGRSASELTSRNLHHVSCRQSRLGQLPNSNVRSFL